MSEITAALAFAEQALFEEYKTREREVWACSACANDWCDLHPRALDRLSAALLDVRMAIGQNPPDPAGMRHTVRREDGSFTLRTEPAR